MTTAEIIEYYAKLLIIQYIGQPKAFEHIKTLVGPVVMDQLPVASQNAFAIDSAIGDQLNVIAKYVGANRQGYDFSGSKTLTDTELRSYVNFKIASQSGSDLNTITNLLVDFVDSEIRVYDYGTMRLSYIVDTTLGSDSYVQFLIKEGAFPRPSGVTLSSIVYSDEPDNFFGMSTHDLPATNATPFNRYISVNPNSHWVSYQDAYA